MSSHKSFIDKVSSQLEVWDYDIDRLEHRLKDIQHEASDRLRGVVDELKGQKQDLWNKLESLEHVSEDIAEDIKTGVDISWSGLKIGLTAALEDAKEFVHPESEADKEE